MGVIVAAGSGILRTVYGTGTATPDLVPVDFVANSFIAAAAHIGTTEKKSYCPVFNCITGNESSITWNAFLDLGREVSRTI